MRFAICNELFEGWSLDDACRAIRAAGYDGVELAPFTLARTITELGPEERARIRALVAEHGLAVSGLHWLLARVPGVHLTSPEAAVRQVTLAYLLELVRACADLGGGSMIFGSPKQRDVLPGVERAQAWAWARDTFRRVAALAGERGVVFCLEPLAPAETNLFSTAADAVRMVREVDHPAFRLILDVKAMSSEAAPIPDTIRAHAADLAYFHANDRNLREPGSGDVDFGPIWRALGAAGYDGWVSIEVFDYKPDPVTIAQRGLAYLRRTQAEAG